MNWISKEDQKEGWKKFCNSIIYPIWIWLITVLIVTGISYMIVTYPENSTIDNYPEVFKNIISIISFLFNFKMSIITSFAALILALFLNFKNENESSWKSPDEFIRKFSYKKYVVVIIHFLGVIWFILFLCKVLNIKGNFIQKDFEIDSEIPSWIFLFLSWFVLSIINHIKADDFSLHDRIMSSYRDVIKIEGGSKNLHKVSNYIYRLHLKNKKNLKWYDYILKNIIPGTKKDDRLTSLVDYSSWGTSINEENNKVIMNPAVMIIIVIVGGIFQSLILWSLGGFIYGVELSLSVRSVINWVVMILYGVVFLAYYFLALHNSIIDWCIISKIYPRGFKIITYFWSFIILYILLLYEHFLTILALINSFTFSRNDYHANWLFDSAVIFLLIVTPLVEIWFYVRALSKVFLDINNCMIKMINCCIEAFIKDTSRVKKIKGVRKLDDNDSGLNTFKIALSVHLQLKSRKSYKKYMRSSGKNIENLDKDLKKAYKLTKKNIK